MAGIAAVLLLIVPHEDAPVQCDVLEVNHVWDCTCRVPRLYLSQVILRDLDEIRDWRATARVARPVYDWERRCYRATWIENGRAVEVRSPVMIESSTDYDRELAEREWLPQDRRRRLSDRP